MARALAWARLVFFGANGGKARLRLRLSAPGGTPRSGTYTGTMTAIFETGSRVQVVLSHVRVRPSPPAHDDGFVPVSRGESVFPQAAVKWPLRAAIALT